MLHAPLAVALLAAGPAAPQDSAPNVTVLDALTGRPVAGAEVFGVQEESAPVWGSFWSLRDAAPTDEQGRTYLPPSTTEERYSWTIVRAPGYAPAGTMEVPFGPSRTVVELWPVVPARVEVLDFLGRPLPLVRLGVAVGCGHTPDVTHAYTDRSGEAILLAVGDDWDIADVFPVGDSVRTTYLEVDWDAATEGTYRTMAEPGAVLEGVLLDAAGRPLVGYSVGQAETHRGPWTRTDARGMFRLHGVEPERCSYLRIKDPGGQDVDDFGGSRLGMTRVLRLGAEPFSDERAGPAGAIALTVRVNGPGPHPEVPVLLWDERTGWCAEASVTPGAPLDKTLRAGRYRVRLGDLGSPYAPLELEPILVASDGKVELEVTVDSPQPARRIEIEDVADATELTVIHRSGRTRSVPFDSVIGSPDDNLRVGVVEAFVPPAGDFGLWLAPLSPDRGPDPVDRHWDPEGEHRLARRP